jgi:hypothetical protein
MRQAGRRSEPPRDASAAAAIIAAGPPAQAWLPAVRVAIALAILAASGCAGYQLGHQTLFRPDIRTIHVPIFESSSLRPQLGEALTEAVIKEIERRTPYKVVTGPNADSQLTGRILQDQKAVVVSHPFGDARAVESEMAVQIRWVDRRGAVLMERNAIPLPPMLADVTQDSVFIPEAGQSLATAQLSTIQQLAREIVNQMELTW